ncbi:MAG: metallophosphoesterase [Armatimonadota bacterium]
MIAIAAVLWALVIAALAFVFYVRYVEPARIVVTEQTVHLRDLPEALRGLRIVHLSDFHCHDEPAIEWSSREAVRLAMEQRPDLIAISGDLFDTCEMAGRCADQLDGLEAPLGVWAVPGNHDRAHDDPFMCLEAPAEDVEMLREVLAERGIRLLANENERIGADGAEIAIAGSDEYAFGRDDVARALSGTADADVVILLCHTPDLLDDPHVSGADLLLCGHTHGGQIQLPGIGAPWAPVWRDRRRASGLLSADGLLAYVSRGVASATRARFNCPPEVAVLTLESGEETEAREVPVRRDGALACSTSSREALEEVVS